MKFKHLVLILLLIASLPLLVDAIKIMVTPYAPPAQVMIPRFFVLAVWIVVGIYYSLRFLEHLTGIDAKTPAEKKNMLTRSEAEIIWSGECLCGGQLLAGPKGGLTQNAKCSECDTIYMVPPKPLLPEKI